MGNQVNHTSTVTPLIVEGLIETLLEFLLMLFLSLNSLPSFALLLATKGALTSSTFTSTWPPVKEHFCQKSVKLQGPILTVQ